MNGTIETISDDAENVDSPGVATKSTGYVKKTENGIAAVLASLISAGCDYSSLSANGAPNVTTTNGL